MRLIFDMGMIYKGYAKHVYDLWILNEKPIWIYTLDTWIKKL